MRTRVSSPNLAQTVAGVKALSTGIRIAKGQSAKIIANQILDDSLTKVPSCPEDTGRLRSTGRVEPVKEGYAVLYGGTADDGTFVDYAAYVHDDLPSGVQKTYTLPGSGPKFVEAHVLRHAETGKETIARALERMASNMFKTFRGGF